MNTAESTLISYLEYHRNCLSGSLIYSFVFKFYSFQKMIYIWQFEWETFPLGSHVWTLGPWLEVLCGDMVCPCWWKVHHWEWNWKVGRLPSLPVPSLCFVLSTEAEILSSCSCLPACRLLPHSPHHKGHSSLRNCNPKSTLSSTSWFGHGIWSEPQKSN